MRLASWLALVAVFLPACTALNGGSTDAEQRPALSGRSGRTSIVEAHTASVALDRITKRPLALDGIVRRSGTGRSATIYVFDGGVADDHPELRGRVRFGFDAYPGPTRTCDGHGTAVAGAAAGATLGVAPEARIVDVKIIDCERKEGSVPAIVAAAHWVVEDHRRHPGPAVANWSFVVDTARDVAGIDSAADLLQGAGTMVVAPAGNLDIDACRVSPANSRRVFVVGASAITTNGAADPQDVRAHDTAWGRCVDLYAPGDSVLLPAGDNAAPRVARWSGTSMAAGYVSGAAALVLEANPSLAPSGLAVTLLRRATDGVVDERHGDSGRRGRLLYVGPMR